MNVLEVSGREFRANQKTFLDLSDKGIQIVLRRGASKAYVITPIAPDDEYERYFTPAILAKIDKSLQQAAEGKVTKAMDKEELLNFLDS